MSTEASWRANEDTRTQMRHEDALCHVFVKRTLQRKLEVEVQHDAVLEDGDEEHDGEACEHAYILQDKVSQLAVVVIFTITMQHLRQLVNKRKFTLNINDVRFNTNSDKLGIYE